MSEDIDIRERLVRIETRLDDLVSRLRQDMDHREKNLAQMISTLRELHQENATQVKLLEGRVQVLQAAVSEMDHLPTGHRTVRERLERIEKDWTDMDGVALPVHVQRLARSLDRARWTMVGATLVGGTSGAGVFAVLTNILGG